MQKIIGIDEAGRGSLAGSMWLVAIETPPKDILEQALKYGLKDSKKMSPRQREVVFNIVHQNKSKINMLIGKYPAPIIDTKGLRYCYQDFLQKAYSKFKDKEIVFDGNTLYGLNLPIKTEPKAESEYVEVALASVIAKYLRDLEISKIAEQYPQYAWDKHNGYPQPIHTEMIKKFGVIEGVHRKSWKTIKKLQDIF